MTCRAGGTRSGRPGRSTHGLPEPPARREHARPCRRRGGPRPRAPPRARSSSARRASAFGTGPLPGPRQCRPTRSKRRGRQPARRARAGRRSGTSRETIVAGAARRREPAERRTRRRRERQAAARQALQAGWLLTPSRQELRPLPTESLRVVRCTRCVPRSGTSGRRRSRGRARRSPRRRRATPSAARARGRVRQRRQSGDGGLPHRRRSSAASERASTRS